MSRYPVPIFQPTVPLDGNFPFGWLEKINHWMSLQFEKNEDFRRQLETQNHLLVQLNRRLDRVFLKLATLETDKPEPRQTSPGAEPNSGAISPNLPANQNIEGSPRNRDSEEVAESDLGPAMQLPKATVSSWQQQREAMLKCLVAQLEIEDSLYPGDCATTLPGGQVEAAGTISMAHFQSQAELPTGDLGQIEMLKEQLHAAIREMEVECSVQRAKLSHERARLEAREVDLERREKKLARESREKKTEEERAEPLVSRIKGMLRRGG